MECLQKQFTYVYTDKYKAYGYFVNSKQYPLEIN